MSFERYKSEAEAFVMRALDKKRLGREARNAASPVLVIVALVLFSVLVLATIERHREEVRVAIDAVGYHGTAPVFVGP
jgi:hypothetical protein